MNGFVLIDKPKGWTSFDVVARIRGLVRSANRQAMASDAIGTQLPKRVKVGHSGTLDPLATGLLVVLVGNYTKRATELTKLDKSYQVTMKLGYDSTTGDEEGTKSLVSELQPTTEQVTKALLKFGGDIMQTPPIYSAMKVNGVRAYKLAREGKAVKLEARPARINSIELTNYNYPLVYFTADVSSGTYIRSLVEDVGRDLGTGAYMSDLRRTRVGQFDLAEAVTIDSLSVANVGQCIRQLETPVVLDGLPE